MITDHLPCLLLTNLPAIAHLQVHAARPLRSTTGRPTRPMAGLGYARQCGCLRLREHDGTRGERVCPAAQRDLPPATSEPVSDRLIREHPPAFLSRSHVDELGHGVHVARRTVLGGRNSQLGPSPPAAVVDKNLARTEPHLLVRYANGWAGSLPWTRRKRSLGRPVGLGRLVGGDRRQCKPRLWGALRSGFMRYLLGARLLDPLRAAATTFG
jgi:hypothetical protein